MSVVLYGIKNCDTIKKARQWLTQNKIEYQFHDFRVDGISNVLIESWLTQVDWEILLNRRGTTWRKLTNAKQDETDKNNCSDLMCSEPTLIKRPVLAYENKFYVGFKPENYEGIFHKKTK